jgi:hypothetical protein
MGQAAPEPICPNSMAALRATAPDSFNHLIDDILSLSTANQIDAQTAHT